MPANISLTEADVRAVVDSGSWTRGRSYYKSGRLIHPQREGDTLRGESVGSALRPYRVEATVNEHGIQDTSCSCPLGGSCKHVVALLLMFVHQPEAFLEMSSLGESLKEVDRAGLLALIERMVEMHPDLRQLVNLPQPGQKASGPRISEVEMRRQVSNALPSDGYDYYGSSDLRQVDNLVRLGDQYADGGDFPNAATVYSAVARELLDQYEVMNDEGGEIGEVVNVCVSGLGRCLDGIDEGPERAEILRTLFDIYKWDIDWGGIDMGYEGADFLRNKTSAAEKERVAAWAREVLDVTSRGDSYSSEWRRKAWGGLLLDMELDSMDDERFLKITRETGRTLDLVSKLLELGGVDEAVEAAKSAEGYVLLQSADLFRQHGHDARAVELVRGRVNDANSRGSREWLRDYAEEQEDWDEVVRLQRQIFEQQPHFDAYRKLKQAAQRAESWNDLRPRVLRRLEQEQQLGVLIQIYLDAEEVDAALRTLRQMADARPSVGLGRPFYNRASLSLQVARAAAESHPREAIEIYADAAAREIAMRQRGHYAAAASHLSAIRDICRRQGEEALWERMISAIREEHTRLRALQDELNKAGL